MAQEEVFDDQAVNGTPRTKLDRLKTVAPPLYANIINARAKGEKFNDGLFTYNIVSSDQYGDTVYKNKNKWQKKTATTTEPTKQEQLNFTPNKSEQTDVILEKILEAITNLESAVGVLNAKIEAVRGKLMGPDKVEFTSGLEQLKNDHGNENQGAGTEGAYVEAGDQSESAENKDYSGEGDGLDEVPTQE